MGSNNGLLTTTCVKAGKEILAYYGHDRRLTFPDDFYWYWDLKRRVDMEYEEIGRGHINISKFISVYSLETIQLQLSNINVRYHFAKVLTVTLIINRYVMAEFFLI